MRYGVYFANWIRTKIQVLLIKMEFVLNLNFHPTFCPEIIAANVFASSGDF